MLMKTLTENNVLFYDEKNYNDFLYNVSQGNFCENSSLKTSSTEAYFVCNIGIVLANIDKWKRCIPHVKLSYKVNANFDPGLIRILKECDLKFSFSTLSEMSDLLNLEIEPSSLIFNSPFKYTRHIVDASLGGVACLTLNTMHELERIVHSHPNPKLLLHVTSVNENFVRLLHRCIELDVTIEGLCYDLPSGRNSDIKVDYVSCFKNLACILNYASEHSITINLINLGSKIPCYSEEENAPFRLFSRFVNQFTSEFRGVNLIAEPTSFLFDGANQVCCNVMGIRHLYDDVAQRTNMFYYLNDGTYGSLSNVFFRGYVPKVEVLEKETFLAKDTGKKVTTHLSTFWGPTCDSMDKICTVDAFPLLSLGDTVVFIDVGAYNLACATNFNGFELPNSRFILSYQKLKLLGISGTTESPKEDSMESTK